MPHLKNSPSLPLSSQNTTKINKLFWRRLSFAFFFFYFVDFIFIQNVPQTLHTSRWHLSNSFTQSFFFFSLSLCGVCQWGLRLGTRTRTNIFVHSFSRRYKELNPEIRYCGPSALAQNHKIKDILDTLTRTSDDNLKHAGNNDTPENSSSAEALWLSRDQGSIAMGNVSNLEDWCVLGLSSASLEVAEWLESRWK